MPAAATVYSYLGQYGGDHGSPGSTAVTTMLARYFRDIAFEGRMMVFSSIDYTQPENKDAFYPKVYRTHIQASQVKAGINFLANPVRSENRNNFDVRVDQKYTEKDYGFFRFSFEDQPSTIPGTFPGVIDGCGFFSGDEDNS